MLKWVTMLFQHLFWLKNYAKKFLQFIAKDYAENLNSDKFAKYSKPLSYVNFAIESEK